jgi:uncharacterized protein YbaR (Trm112 family)
MPLDQLLIDLLACPFDKEPLVYFADTEVLYNPRLKKAFRVEGAIPVLLPSEATDVDSETAENYDAELGAGRGVMTGGGAASTSKSR